MAQFKVGIVGCGRRGRTEGATGSGTAHVHAAGYLASPDCEIVAAADIRKENLDLFTKEYGIPRGYPHYREMLAQEDLDIVSVCVWPALHAPVVIDAAQAGVRAIHCEKPMAPTWGEAKQMAAVCQEHRVQLTFNHQRRFGKLFRKAKELLDAGAIGKLVRLEAFTVNLYDWGTHWFDMMFFYNDDEPAEWAIGQIDARGGRTVFGMAVEGQGLSLIKWRNGVLGLMATGSEIVSPDEPATRDGQVANRLIGTDGAIEVGVRGGPQVRLRSPHTRGRWQGFHVGEPEPWVDVVTAAVLHVVDALKAGIEPQLSARRALQATELIFATYESSRRRGRVDLPLETEDSPFLSMLEAGMVSPQEPSREECPKTIEGAATQKEASGGTQ